MNRIRRFSHEVLERPERPSDSQMTAGVAELVQMGFPHGPAKRQLALTNGNVQKAAESLVHAAHGTTHWDSHPDCPICVREQENVRVAEGRRPSLSRVRSAGHPADGENKDEAPRRGSVSAMLRRPSVADALRRMKSNDVK